ncbi:sensor histidine kinase [Acuticoccus mangrovi]|uniref:histidine kinase n=1 Tax=Acuticoccus mangrovi TaxID=2796142 RepID=A0A934MHD8_9HYPH|nr:PAS domain-containing sensor histidine kinase [Acuticoccus mangrovi]MBJ3776845.1 PAS-domain containing protein [Acuticoccus mangrovi]
MLAAWAVTAAVSAVAAGVVARAGQCVRERRRAEARAMAAETEAALAALALERGAVGALRVMGDGTLLACGEVPEEVRRAVTAGDGVLGRAVRTLLDEGIPFRHALTGASAVAGSLEGGHPTLLVSRWLAGAADSGLTGRLEALLARAPHPAWIATDAGERVWANPAYSRMVGGAEEAAAGEALLDANAEGQLSATLADGLARERVSTVVAGERRLFDVTADKRDGTLAALAVDVTEANQALVAQTRALESHAATFDRLATAVAIYGPDQRLTFHNAAFQTLWGLPAAFLEQAPPEERVLDRLRADRRLPETADFKAWKRDQLKGYETREGFERWWHLPDGQTLRVIANPGSDGGVTYIYENVTEQLALERRYNALSRVQAETIDNLGEGIASFGPDGLLRLANPAFWSLTGVPAAEVGDHVRAIADLASDEDRPAWAALVERVTGLTDHRTAAKGRLERRDGRVLDYAFSPLPDGSTLATFADVTDSVNVARALVERNNALVEADRLKNAFIEHVSYELRSPLNTIIGFTQLLTRAETGDLTDRQREYANYISTSSEALLVIIDGILDLATIDAGIMELAIAPVDVRAAVRQVLDGLKDRVAEAALDIRIEIDDDARTFEGDAQRVRQILFNLLSNAVSHSPPGGCITIAARRDRGFVAVSVRDRGPGIAEEKAEAVFERFHTTGAGGRRGGVGLGLALVKSFVELHGGTVSVAPVEGPGAELVVRFPLSASGEAPAVKDAA